MKKLCCIFNIPSLYREAIYLNIDKEYNCEWYFEKENVDVALFDTSKLKSVHMLEHKDVLGRAYRMKGLTGLLWRRNDFDAYMMVGAPMCISLWVLCLLSKVFHPKKKIYFWTHGWYGKESRSERIIKKAFLKLADELILYGNYAKGLLVKQGFKAEKMHVIHNSLSYDVQLSLRKQITASDVYKEHFGNNNPVLIFIGRLTPVKKLDMLLDSLAALSQKGKQYNLVFVGNGSEKDFLEKKTTELGLKEQVWFYGACYDEKTNAELIYNADLCVAPGNIGLTAMHVLMFGCPAITHNDFAYQMPEFEAIVPYKTGNFFARGSVASLSEVIEDWFTVNQSNRVYVRECCYNEIYENWTPAYQMDVLQKVLG